MLALWHFGFVVKLLYRFCLPIMPQRQNTTTPTSLPY